MVDLDLHLIKDSVKYVDDPVKLRNTILILIDHIKNVRKKIEDRTIDGLMTDGGHHKQWCLEQILILLGVDLEMLREKLNQEDYDWEPGIPP